MSGRAAAWKRGSNRSTSSGSIAAGAADGSELTEAARPRISSVRHSNPGAAAPSELREFAAQMVGTFLVLILLPEISFQDGNPLLSTVAALLWYLEPESREEKLDILRRYLFTEI